MKRLTVRSCVIPVTAVLCLASVLRLQAQTTAPDKGQKDEEAAIVLSPFVVDAAEDADSYTATSTLAGTRVRTELKDTASSISVVTKQFLQDTGSKNSMELLPYTPNTEVGGVGGNFGGVGNSGQFSQESNLLRPSSNNRVRGLDAADNTRDYFLTEIPWDGFNVDRVDLQRGPNSILFGVGSPAGIINTSVNGATFKNKNVVENRFDKFGSIRWSADFNYVLVPKVLAVRVALLDDTSKFRQKPAFNHDKRIFGAVQFSPKLFGEGAKTSIHANVESGRVSANRPRYIPPVDAITPWFYTAADSAGNRALNKFTYDQSKVNNQSAPFDTTNAANRAAYPQAWTNNGAVGRQFWLDVVGFYGNNLDSNPTAFRQPGPSQRNGISSTGAIDGSLNAPNAHVGAIASFSAYMTASGIPGGGSYADRTISDPTVFDFYNKLIDGNNSFEWQKWDSFNVAASQTLFHDRLAAELVYDHQNYSDGQRAFVGTSDTYKIGIDIADHFLDGSANPNVGRAYVANSSEQANVLNNIVRDGVRFTVTGEVRAEDFLDKSSLITKILGRHTFTGLESQDVKKTFTKNWATSALDPSYTDFTGENPSLTAHFRSYNYVSYISGNLSGMSSAAGANIDRVQNIVSAPKTASIWVFDNHWAKPTSPTAPGYVDPAAIYTYTAINSGLPVNPVTPAIVTSTQSENPANYGGWVNKNFNFLNADAGDIDALTYNAARIKNVIRSEGLTWQGHMFNDSFIPVFGWRKDKIENSSASAVPDVLGIANTNVVIDSSQKKIQEGESKSYGAVYHLPEKWTAFLPGKTKLSFFYNRSENFKADTPRGDVFGNVIANPIGKTKDYGFVINTLDDKLSFKTTWYKTTVNNASLGGANPLGQNSYYLWAVPVWGTAFVTNADQGIKGNNDNNAWAWNYAANDDSAAPQFKLPDGSMNPAWLSHPSTVKEIAAITAWRQLPLNQQFFNAYGNEVSIMSASAIAAGNWTVADPIWAKKFDNQPISGGQLAGFGQGPTFTVTTVSQGLEFEVFAQPTKNWNIMINASKTKATRQELAPTIVNLINAMTTFLDGPAGDIRLWGGGVTNSFRTNWHNNIVNPYNNFKSQEGSNAPEIAPWRFNGVTTYNFNEGALKGSFIGGGYRWEQARVLGYKYSTAIGNLDVFAPWKGKSDSHLDLWLGRTQKLSSKVNWRVQLNLRSVGESTKLVPITINPDGTTAYSRIQEGMVWQLTNTFEF